MELVVMKSLLFPSTTKMLTLSQPIRNDQPITLSYNDPSPANDVLALQDPEGNDVSTFSINRYLNLSVVSGPGPVFQGAETTNDGRIVLTYDQPLDSSFVQRCDGIPQLVADCHIGF